MTKNTAADHLSNVPMFASSKKELAAIAKASDQLSVATGMR